MYNSILIPLDGSEYDAKALPHVSELAEKGTKATRLRVIHSIEELAESTFVEDVEMSQDLAAREAYDRIGPPPNASWRKRVIYCQDTTTTCSLKSSTVRRPSRYSG